MTWYGVIACAFVNLPRWTCRWKRTRSRFALPIGLQEGFLVKFADLSASFSPEAVEAIGGKKVRLEINFGDAFMPSELLDDVAVTDNGAVCIQYHIHCVLLVGEVVLL